MRRRSIEKTRNLFHTMKLAAQASRICGTRYFTVLSHALSVCNQGRFLPEEAFRLGLFDPAVSDEEQSRYLSRKNLTRIQKSLNPESWAPLLKDKSLFYRYCIASDVAVPQLYGIFVKGSAGWCFDGSVVDCLQEWMLFFEEKVGDEFVTKPSRSAFGDGVKVFGRDGSGFVDSVGKRYMSSDIVSMMALNSECDSVVIQERLKNHPEIVRLTDTRYLQTARITTVIDAHGCCHIIHTHFKLITGQGITDGFDHGRSGNSQAMICPEQGILKSAVTMAPDGSGMKNQDLHPKTGRSITGFHLPLWHEACALVKETAPKFLPLRTIGWDVGLTPSGPVIVEGNVWWDPPNQHRRTHEFMDVLLQSMP